MARWKARRLLASVAFVAVVAGAVAMAPRGADRAIATSPTKLSYEEPAQLAPSMGALFPSPDLTGFVDRSAVPAATNGIFFGQPTIVGIQGTGFEPDIRLDPSSTQRAYASVPASLSSDTSWIWWTRDAGKTWKWVPASQPMVGKSVACAGGGDTELAVDANGSVYFNDLTLLNFSVARSDDNGTTWSCNHTGVPSTIVDRQWYAIDGNPQAITPAPPVANSLYLASNNVGQGAPQCPVSGAGNNVLVVYRSLPGPLAGLQFGPANQAAGLGTCDEGIMGNVEVSPKASRMDESGNPTGLPAPGVHQVYVIHDDASFSKIRIARCIPVAPGPPLANTSDPSGLRCVDRQIADLGDFTTVRTGANFPSLAIDRSGNLYAVWQQAPVDVDGNIRDFALRYSYSTDEGQTWSPPMTIPTPGLNNNVMTWAAAGDDGRVDIVWYGTSATVPAGPYDPLACILSGGVPPPSPRGSTDLVNGTWNLYMVQTLNGHDAGGVTFTDPIGAGEYPVHRGSIATVAGGLCGDRTAQGDFFKMRVGPQGEANVIYSNSTNAQDIGHVMFVRQTEGSGLYAGQTPSGDGGFQYDSVTDPAGDGIRELSSAPSGNIPNLDITGSSLSRPNPGACHPAATPCYRVTMTLSNLALAPDPQAVDTDLVWHTQWITPSSPTCASAATGCTRGGRNFHVYAESQNGGALRCFYGENAITAQGGGVTTTYPPAAEITAANACKAALGPGGSITIEVPIADVSLEAGVNAFNANRLFSVTASTQTLSAPSDSVPVFGVQPDVIDVARSYEATLGVATATVVRSFRVERAGRIATIRWRTASEVGLAGFDVYRGASKLNRSLIRAHGDATGHVYVWRGRVPAGSHGGFRLQLVRL